MSLSKNYISAINAVFTLYVAVFNAPAHAWQMLNPNFEAAPTWISRWRSGEIMAERWQKNEGLNDGKKVGSNMNPEYLRYVRFPPSIVFISM